MEKISAVSLGLASTLTFASVGASFAHDDSCAPARITAQCPGHDDLPEAPENHQAPLTANGSSVISTGGGGVGTAHEVNEAIALTDSSTATVT